jgi:hypothetical protein
MRERGGRRQESGGIGCLCIFYTHEGIGAAE